MVSQTFTPVSPERWQAIKQAFSTQAGINIATDSGQGDHMGVKFSWAYDGTTLIVEVISTSFVDKMAGENEQKVLEQFSAWIDGVQ